MLAKFKKWNIIIVMISKNQQNKRAPWYAAEDHNIPLGVLSLIQYFDKSGKVKIIISILKTTAWNFFFNISSSAYS